jgi:hypothetical protein
MFSLLLIMFACIPREDPPEKVLYLDKINSLPGSLSENSGMISSGSYIWFIEDSGNEPVLYGYDSNQNKVELTVAIKNVQNTDWEDITQNENYIFIGDFGNNSGSRENLRIVVLNKADLETGADTIIPFGFIYFSYEDQTDFTSAPKATAFDCEAFIATSGHLILFTKDWVTAQTRIYTVPATPGTYSAEFEYQWDIEGLITSAAFSEGSQELVLLGYTPIIPFIWIYAGFDPDLLTFESRNRTDFTTTLGLQTEGVLITNSGSILISSEANATSGSSAGLYRVSER